jgi:uncharacterized membrane protein
MKLFVSIFVSLLAISAQAKILYCVGTEPFWGADINLTKGLVTISDTENVKGTTVKAQITPAAGTSLDYAFVAKSKYTLLAVVGNETCSDGMSDEKYSHSVILTGYGAQPLVGCCRE